MNQLETLTQNPIIIRAFRNRRANWRIITALLLAALGYCPACLILTPYTVGSIIYESQQFLVDIDEAGLVTFNATAIFLFVLVTMFAPTVSAGAIAGERQRQTLDLLRVTLLPARSIVIGKLVSSLIYTILLILIVWPVIIFALISGGVGFAELIVTVLLLVVTAVSFTAIGLFVSSLGQTITNTTMLTYGVVLPALFIAPPLTMLAVTIGLNFAGAGYQIESMVNFYGWALVLSLNPLGAAIYSAIAYADTAAVFFTSITVASNKYYLLSPWFIFIIFYTAATWFLVQVTIRRLETLSE